MKSFINKGKYVSTSVKNTSNINKEDIICKFREQEKTIQIIKKLVANKLDFPYIFIVSSIALKVYSVLNSLGLTMVLSIELVKKNISCNVATCFYDYSVFASKKDKIKAIEVPTNHPISY